MNPPKCNAEDDIQWLIASPKFATCTEAARTAPRLIAHDAYTHLLDRLEPNSDAPWQEVSTLISLTSGFLVFDDTTIDKPYGPHIQLVTRHWSGKHRDVVDGINLSSLIWTDGDIAIPIDWRVFDKQNDGLTKNDHLRQMLQTAQLRGFQPQCVLWDSWYSSLENLKLLHSWGWAFFVGLKSNRQTNPDGQENREGTWNSKEFTKKHTSRGLVGLNCTGCSMSREKRKIRLASLLVAKKHLERQKFSKRESLRHG